VALTYDSDRTAGSLAAINAPSTFGRPRRRSRCGPVAAPPWLAAGAPGKALVPQGADHAAYRHTGPCPRRRPQAMVTRPRRSPVP